ncbi:hypothetical protein Tco_0505348 [Tanacetum coccineum]
MQYSVVHQPPQEETSFEFLQDKRNLINSVQTFLRKFNRFSFYETPKVVSLAWETILEIENAFEDKQYQPEGILELFRKLHNDVQNIHEELAEYINTLRIVKADLDPKGDIRFIENLMHDNSFPRPLETLKDDSETVINSNNDYSLSDDDSYEDIDYVDAATPILLSALRGVDILSPIPVEDGDSFLEKFKTTPELETFKFDIEEKNSGSNHAHISLPDLECFYLKSKPDSAEFDLYVSDPGIREESVSSSTK